MIRANMWTMGKHGKARALASGSGREISMGHVDEARTMKRLDGESRFKRVDQTRGNEITQTNGLGYSWKGAHRDWLI
jgi:hypothetical protein